MKSAEVLNSLDGLGFPEALRWRNGELWFSDMFRSNVVSWNLEGSPEVVLSADQGGPEMPGGLGWTPQGELLVVDCLKRLILKLDHRGELSTYADLSALTHQPLNDMHVDADGTAWVGGYGFNPETDQPVESSIYRITPDAELSTSAAKFVFPNGCERYGRLIAVAETFADRISFFDDGFEVVKSFSCPSGSGPDGLSFDAAGKLYVALAFSGEIIRFDANGNSQMFHNLSAESATAGGVKGIFDCAVHPSDGVIAFSSACLDENFAMAENTGSITILKI